MALAIAALLALAAPLRAHADASVPKRLAEKARVNPDAIFPVIVQGAGSRSEVATTLEQVPAKAARLKRGFVSLPGVSADLTGRQLLMLSRRENVVAITEDARVVLSGLTNEQRWPQATGVTKFWPAAAKSRLQPPTIAIVDSGIDAGREDFGGRVVEQLTMTSLPGNSTGDGRGHGTFVASIAAGAAKKHAGAAPNARLVSIDVTDDAGMGLTSDVIAAADWILANKDRLDIRVANFSLHGSQRSTFRFDPLDKAVERLWFSGVVVVTAAGNYGDQETGVLYAPANDPFVITVGAADISDSVKTKDDFAAPWSSYGSTLDGFAKPDLAAPGRYMIGAVPPGATLAHERPDRVVEPGYLLMSGTSLAAPVVSGAAANLLAEHPRWTPDQVKGALMATARPISGAYLSSGAGEVDADAASDLASPPNPNLSLNRFVGPDRAGGPVPVFDEATWTSSAKADPVWDAATWTSATWTSATWTSEAWDAATWTSATWTSATWTSATWLSADDATWTSSADSE